ncbi:MAG: V-type ATP synthase subunit A, partial [Ruminococcus sp.]|nr:V-type ATP synthase subunit A [Ruminococcus sp.]
KLIGMDALSANDRIKMETARSIREDFLHQLAFHEVDTYTSLKKQLYMMKLILMFNDKAVEAVQKGADVEEISGLPVRERIGRFKYVSEEKTGEEFEKISLEISSTINQIVSRRDN